MPQWLVIIVVGVIVYGISLAPPVPIAWKPFLQWIGGLLVLVGVILLLLIVLHIPLPGT